LVIVEGCQGARQNYINASNDTPKAFVWTKTADEILASVARFCAHTLAENS
jgi:Tol biopolymer transport system component